MDTFIYKLIGRILKDFLEPTHKLKSKDKNMGKTI